MLLLLLVFWIWPLTWTTLRRRLAGALVEHIKLEIWNTGGRAFCLETPARGCLVLLPPASPATVHPFHPKPSRRFGSTIVTSTCRACKMNWLSKAIGSQERGAA